MSSASFKLMIAWPYRAAMLPSEMYIKLNIVKHTVALKENFSAVTLIAIRWRYVGTENLIN